MLVNQTETLPAERLHPNETFQSEASGSIKMLRPEQACAWVIQ